jgi:hypothetical protein
MKIRNLFLPSVALGAAFLVATPEESKGFTLLGHSLNPNQADFRVFNNFTDSAANNNTTPHDQYPGYTGAVMALWKGVTEWGSEAHGDGSGDTQQAVIGSGGSSFDPIFNGEATSTGVIGNNIISELNQNGGGVLAFMQGGSNGWWIRFHSNHTWADGPGTVSGSQFDLQGTGCHEYGHSLGLNHSFAGGSPTMSAFSNGTGYVDRSISNDDQLGVQAVYGLANSSGTKPTITQVINLGGQVKIIGTNFKDNNNEVWFTRLTPGSASGGGNPIKVTGVSAINNSEITVNIPATAGPGDIQVLRNGLSQEATSQTFPFDPFSTPPPAPTISSVSPPQIQPLLATGGPSVVLTGTGFTGASSLIVNDTAVGVGGTSFGGSWNVISDTQISFVMPLTGSAGVVDIDLITPGGSITSQIEIVAPSSPVLAVQSPNLIQAAGLSIATSSQDLDVVILQFSVVDGATTIPGLIDLELGGGVLNNIKKAKTWTLGPKFSRKLDSGPVSGLPVGLKIYFEGLVLPVAQAYDFPWDSTNKLTVTVLL